MYRLVIRLDLSVDLGVGITQLDGDVTLELVLETHSHHTRQRFHHCRFSVRYVANGSHIDRRLSAVASQPNLVRKQLQPPLCVRTKWSNLMTSGVSGVSFDGSRFLRSCSSSPLPSTTCRVNTDSLHTPLLFQGPRFSHPVISSSSSSSSGSSAPAATGTSSGFTSSACHRTIREYRNTSWRVTRVNT